MTQPNRNARLMRWIMPAATFATLALASTALAQRSHASGVIMVRVGDRVRIGLTDSITHAPFVRPKRTVIGVVRGIVPDTLYVEDTTGAEPSALARALITDVYLSEAPASRAQTALQAGFAFGVYGGLARMRRTENHSRLENSMIGAGIGTALGVLFGLINPIEHWVPAWLPE